MWNKSIFSKRPPLYRFCFINSLIKSREYPNTQRLASELEVSRRTIFRDIEYLKDQLGAPLAFCRKKRGYYYTQKDYSMDLVRLTEGEMIALFLGHNLLLQCRGTPYEKPVKSAFQKICLQLQDLVTVDLDELNSSISFDMEPLRGIEENVAQCFDIISKAIEKKETLHMHYYSISADKKRWRSVDPYHLRYFQGGWYLIGYCRLREEIRIFALDRVLSIIPTGRFFPGNHGFDVQQFFEDSFYLFKGEKACLVKIFFSPGAARFIEERQWHSSQKIEKNADSTLVLTITVSGLQSVKRWILGFGSEAKVLEPLSLAQEVHEEIKKAAELYREV